MSGQTVNLGTQGYAPTVRVNTAVNPEQARYERMWEHEEYRARAPGERLAYQFLTQVKPERDATMIDFGCGTGRGALMLALLAGLKVTMVDFAENCLDPEIRLAVASQGDRLAFVHGDVTKPLAVSAKYGYCTDVMEHLREEDVPFALRNILSCAKHVFFNIAQYEEPHGEKYEIGQLHLTVKPASWWVKQFKEAGAEIHWLNDDGIELSAYVSAWRDASKVIEGNVNVPYEVLEKQIRQNIEAGYRMAMPHAKQDRHVVVLAGGPSLSDHLDDIRRLREEGAALVTMNGSYHWALDNGLSPSVQIVVDAREHNARFTRPLCEGTKYLLASQVHPSAFEGLPKESVFLWHSGITDEYADLVREKYGEYWPVPGGSTVMLRALPLLRMLGMWRFHIFGFDSCVSGDRHHAYQQSENDGEPLMPAEVGGRMFMAHPWMLSQASEFRALSRMLGDEVELEVYGDGLIAHMIKTGASLSQET